MTFFNTRFTFSFLFCSSRSSRRQQETAPRNGRRGVRQVGPTPHVDIRRHVRQLVRGGNAESLFFSDQFLLHLLVVEDIVRRQNSVHACGKVSWPLCFSWGGYLGASAAKLAPSRFFPSPFCWTWKCVSVAYVGQGLSGRPGFGHRFVKMFEASFIQNLFSQRRTLLSTVTDGAIVLMKSSIKMINF